MAQTFESTKDFGFSRAQPWHDSTKIVEAHQGEHWEFKVHWEFKMQ